MERDFKGVWIPKNIWLDNELGWTEKLLLIEIDSLVTNGECFASNKYFGDFFNLSKDRISKIISELNRKGYIELRMIYKKESKQIEKRIITTKGYRRKQLEGIGGNTDRGIGENNEDNNTSFNKTINNTKTNTDFLSKNPRELFYYDNCNHFLDNIFSKIDYDSNFDEELSNAEEMLKYFYHKFYNKYGYPMTSLTNEQETETAKIIDSNLGNMSEIKFCFYYVDYYLAEKRSKTAKDPNKKYHSFIQFIKGLDFEMMSERANKSGVNDIDFSYEENIA